VAKAKAFCTRSSKNFRKRFAQREITEAKIPEESRQ
jgi:hypothetical protein